jgi:hypothetical protein
MPKKPHLIDRVSKRADGELEATAEALALKVQAELFDDLERVSDRKMTEHVRRSAASDPGYLPKLLKQVGPREFNRLWDAAFAGGVPPSPLPPVAAAMPAAPNPVATEPPDPAALGPNLQARAQGGTP